MHAGGGQTGGEAGERQVKPMRDALLVIDMQNGVFATPRHARAAVVGNINRLMAAAPHTVVIRHTDDDMPAGSAAWQLLPELHVPAAAVYLDKTACNAFYRTALAATLAEWHCRDLTICGCATDYCVDSTIKAAAALDYHVTVAADAHTTGNRPPIAADVLIAYYNNLWAQLILPDNPVRVRGSDSIIAAWQAVS